MAEMLDVLPTQFNDATNRTIELIDVLWLKSNTILAAFEIEATTSIYSGPAPYERSPCATTEPRFSPKFFGLREGGLGKSRA